LGVFAAPAVWSGGLAAGPAAAAALWTDGRPRCRRAAVGMIGIAFAAACVILVQSRRYFSEDAVVNEFHHDLWPRPIQGVLNAIQAVVEAPLLMNLGVDATVSPLVATVIMALVAGLWYASRGRGDGPNALEASGATLVATSALLVYLFRGNLSYSSLRPVGWYYTLPHLGVVLIGAGWWSGLDRGVGRGYGLTWRDAVVVSALIASLCAVHAERVQHLQIAAAPPLTDSEKKKFPVPELQAPRAIYLMGEVSERLRRTLHRLDQVEQIALREGIGKGAIRRAFGRVLVPCIPKRHTADAASLLRIPAGDTLQSAARVRKLLGIYYRNEPLVRPPWLLPTEPWPSAPPDS
jgi:hypothetical protein